jgi:hypothetical protein
LEKADRILSKIKGKLRDDLSVEYTVNQLIQEARDVENLAKIFVDTNACLAYTRRDEKGIDTNAGYIPPPFPLALTLEPRLPADEDLRQVLHFIAPRVCEACICICIVVW